MAYKRLKVVEPSLFFETVEKATSMAPQVFVLFTGAIQEETGRSWCPDCTRADPIIDKVMSEVGEKGVLVEAEIRREDLRSNDDYMYKTNKKINLACVPTLINWANPKIQLGDSQCQDEALVRTLLLEG